MRIQNRGTFGAASSGVAKTGVLVPGNGAVATAGSSTCPTADPTIAISTLITSSGLWNLIAVVIT